MNKFLMITILAILALSLNACVPDYKSGNTTTNTDSNNDNSVDNSITDSNVTYTQAEQDILDAGYVPTVDGVCNDGYFWCPTSAKCLPATSGTTCPVNHTEEDEAEAQELIENN